MLLDKKEVINKIISLIRRRMCIFQTTNYFQRKARDKFADASMKCIS